MSKRSPVWPIDTTAGRILMLVVAPLLAVGGYAVLTDDDGAGPAWGWGLLGVAVLITGIFMSLWNRGYFGHAVAAAREASPEPGEAEPH